MLISNVPLSTTPYLITAACIVAAALEGKKFGLALSCKIVGITADVFGKESAPWHQSSQNHLSLAIKDAGRDVAAIGGIAVIGITSYFLGKSLDKFENMKSLEKIEDIAIKNGMNRCSLNVIIDGKDGLHCHGKTADWNNDTLAELNKIANKADKNCTQFFSEDSTAIYCN